MEMESSTQFTLGTLAAVRTGMISVVYSNRVKGIWMDDLERIAGDKAAEPVGMEAVRLLATMDAWKKEHQKPYYVPQMLEPEP
jgi:uridine phosphorylase